MKSQIVKDPHILYECSVQDPEFDLEFFAKTFKRRNRRVMRTLREDFCGTATLACQWVGQHADNRAWGVDLDKPTLDWGREHHVSRLDGAADRVELIQGDVLTTRTPPADIVAALNFSYSIFTTREQLRNYFAQVRKSLKGDGMFFLDAFGGKDTPDECLEKRKIPATKYNGIRVAPFTYIWEQEKYNIIDNHITCHISFKLKDGTKLKRAFTYDWRLWSLPELQELLLEAGFAAAEVWLDDWDEDEGDGNGIFKKRKHYDNQEGWVGYVVGLMGAPAAR